MSPDSPCPPAEVLRRSLDPDGLMTAAERQRVEAHVERCGRGCKQMIDALLRDRTRPAVAATAASPIRVGLPSPARPGGEPTLPVDTAVTLTDTLRRCRLVDPAQYAELDRLQGTFPSPRALAGELIRRGWLSPYQVNRVLVGRGQELVLGSYVLLERLGEGGMGEVFKARNWKLGKIVALKLIRKERIQDPDSVRRFQREVRAAAMLDHPNLVRAIDADEVQGTHVLVMEYVPGTDLAKLVRKHGALPVIKACDYVRQAALGLQYACERGLVHRDVKPHNLVVTPQGVVKVLDMGLARLEGRPGEAASTTVTPEGAVMGTPDYMAPEQSLDSHTVDIRADLYALGGTLYFLLAGRVPFPGGTLGEKIARHQMREPTAVEEVVPGTPPAVAAVVRKLMAKRPEDRYQTPAEAAAALEAATRSSQAAAAREVREAAPGGSGAASEGTLTVHDTLASTTWPDRRRQMRASSRRRLVFYVLSGLASLGAAGLLLALLLRFVAPPTAGVPPPRTQKDGPSPAAVPDARAVVFDRWVKETAALPAEQQVKAVAAKLKELNPGFDGNITPQIGNGVVLGLAVTGHELADISPLRALAGLTYLACDQTQVSELSPLTGMRLTYLHIGGTKVSDLSPLKGMPLTTLVCGGTQVSDLAPLKDMPLTELNIDGTKVSDLSPLRGMPLTTLNCGGTGVADLLPLRGMPLVILDLHSTRVSDLSPLEGMQLTQLWCQMTRVADLSPLKAMPLTHLAVGGTKVSDLSPLKGMPLIDLSCDQTQVSELSPLAGMRLSSLTIAGTKVSDLSPLQGMPLAKLDCNETQVTDLSPLQGMPLKVLWCGFQPMRDAEILRSIKTLETINDKPAAEVLAQDAAPATRP